MLPQLQSRREKPNPNTVTPRFRSKDWISSIVSSLIPVLFIFVLYIVHYMPATARLVVIAGSGVLISVCLVRVTNVKHSEAFAVTAA